MTMVIFSKGKHLMPTLLQFPPVRDLRMATSDIVIHHVVSDRCNTGSYITGTGLIHYDGSAKSRLGQCWWGKCAELRV